MANPNTSKLDKPVGKSKEEGKAVGGSVLEVPANPVDDVIDAILDGVDGAFANELTPHKSHTTTVLTVPKVGIVDVRHFETGEITINVNVGAVGDSAKAVNAFLKAVQADVSK